MGNIYFDICAIPLFLIILFVCYSRRMIKGNTNHLFIAVVFISLITAVADLCIEIPQGNLPMSQASCVFCNVSTYVYLIMRNATSVVLLLFLLHLTRTSFLIRNKLVKIIFSLPYAVILILLMQNPFTHNVFYVSVETGYERGPLMLVLYIVALIYGIVGFAYSIFCRRYLPLKKWLSLLSIYLLAYTAVFIQFFSPDSLLEMFFTAVGEMLVMLAVMRPEERMDSEVGMLSWASYQWDLKNILRSHEHVQIIVALLQNGREMRNYLGDQKYNEYLSRIADVIRSIKLKHTNRAEIYFERPGTFYIITEADESLTEDAVKHLMLKVGEDVRKDTNLGVRSETRVCMIRCPEDLNKAEDIISLGHKFSNIDSREQTVAQAKDIVNAKTFAVEVHIEDILGNAIRENRIEMHYQPIYDVKSGRFCSAEALARINDPEYGLLPPGMFIPEAEAQGLIIPLGDAIMEQVFRFVSEHDLDILGLRFIEMNISVAQCMESALPEKLRALQEKYDVDPARINLEITETTYEDISKIMLENIGELIKMGYSFALDDYGTGYSNIQRVNQLPLKLVKIDKSVLDEIYTENGRTILEYTMRMMQKTGKLLVVEGAETPEVVEMLENMGCDYIQGFYFSKPLPADEFIDLIKEKNQRILQP
ncbi:MAG: EAL domain-containing protein [Clostridia bacterium]|nr:EAL domain-containing protein [Clostridia bacterium]